MLAPLRNPILRSIALGTAIAAALAWPGVPRAVEKIQVLALFKDRAMLVLDGKRRMLEAGESSPEGVTLVSADSESAVVEIGGERRTLGIGTHIGASFEGPSLRSVKIWPSAQEMYTVEGSIEGTPVRFLVDTGATSIAVNRSEARRLGIDYERAGQPSVATTASGTINTWRIRLRTVKVGDIVLRDVDAAVIDAEYPEIPLLGMSFLGRLDMRREGAMLELREKF